MVVLSAALSATAQDAANRVILIPQQPFAQPVPVFIGAPAVPRSVLARLVPQNPFLAPNVVSQLSLVTGLEYTYSNDPSPADAPYTDPWYFAAVDFHTGETVHKVLISTGILYNSYYSSVYLGPDGKTAYVGVIGGLVRIHETL